MDKKRVRGLLTAIFATVSILLFLDLFFISISLMGAFKEIGSGYGQQLINELAYNPLIGLFMGILITAIIQSSSTTTSLVVGLVAGGALGHNPEEAIQLAIPIIMGSNVGTSVTNTIVSLTHAARPREFERAFSAAIVHDFFNIMCVLLFFPLQMATNFLGKSATMLGDLLQGSGGVSFSSPIKILVSPQKDFIHKLLDSPLFNYLIVTATIMYILFQLIEFTVKRTARDQDNSRIYLIASVAFGLLFALAGTQQDILFHKSTTTFILALVMLLISMTGFVKTMRSMVMEKAENLFHKYVFRTPLIGMGFGLIITALVQSSSVTTSIAVPLAGAGIINLYQVFPYTMGANVGTTVTAILAALAAGESTGLIVALAHFLFNVFGIIVFFPMRKIPITLAKKFAALAMKNRMIPLAAIILFYIGLPLLVIMVAR